MREASANPPEELLIEPSADPLAALGGWLVVARNRRVNRDWEALVDRSPENALRWYKYLRKWPTTRYPGRVFPLRGSVYRGAWECEITGGDRLYYLPDEAAKKVVVYYAGPHCKSAPRP
jgi:hypothetical protein